MTVLTRDYQRGKPFARMLRNVGILVEKQRGNSVALKARDEERVSPSSTADPTFALCLQEDFDDFGENLLRSPPQGGLRGVAPP